VRQAEQALIPAALGRHAVAGLREEDTRTRAAGGVPCAYLPASRPFARLTRNARKPGLDVRLPAGPDLPVRCVDAASVYVLHNALADLLPGFRAVRGSVVGRENARGAGNSQVVQLG